MSESKYREWILDTIDSLRSRKARPDLERICRMVRRRHGSEPDRTCAELEKLIQEQTVLKVNYKGSISYRNAAKVQRRSRKKDDVTLTTAARRSTVEEASHSDLSNGDSAFGPVDQDEEDLEVCWGWCEEACSTSPPLTVKTHLSKLTCGGKSKAAGVSGLREKNVFLSLNGEWWGEWFASAPKLPQTGSVGWTSLERCRGGDEKKTKVRVKSESIVFYSRAPVVKHFEPAMWTLKDETGKVAPSCPSATTRATIISSRKRFSSPKVSVPRRGGVCQASKRGVGVARKLGGKCFQNKGVKVRHWKSGFILKAAAGCSCFHFYRLSNVGVGEGKKVSKHRGCRSLMGDVGTFLGWLFFPFKIWDNHLKQNMKCYWSHIQAYFCLPMTRCHPFR